MKLNRLTAFLKSWWKPLAGAAGMAVMVVYAGGMLHEKTSPEMLPRKAGRPVPDGAPVIDLAPRVIASRIDIVGSTASERSIQISPRLSAEVVEILASAGDRVTNGQVLVRLDDRTIREQVTAAEAMLRQAESEYRRTRQLFEKDATTEQALTAAESAYKAAAANAEQISVLRSYATVVSPIDGIITERHIEAGDLAHPGQALLGLYDPTDMRLEVPVPVRLIDQFQLGQERIATLDFPSGVHTAIVTEIVGDIDARSRTRRVKLRLSSAGGDILPGTFGRIWAETDPREAVLIPPAAIVRVGQLEMVDLVSGDRILRRLIKTGPVHDGEVEVLSGLNPGDRILAQPAREE